MMTAMIAQVYVPDVSTVCPRPLFLVPVSAGYPSPADDYLEGTLDLNRHLIKHAAATFFVKVKGDSMIEAGIHTGDLLIVDRALVPTENHVVIAVVNSELTVKRLCKRGGTLFLMPGNGKYEPLPITAGTDFEIWGVVTTSFMPSEGQHIHCLH
jgi:DNA polymerase V